MGKFQRLLWLGLLLQVAAVPGAGQPVPPHVLILYTYRNNTAPFEAIASAFKTALVRDLGTNVVFYEEPLEVERYSDPQLETAYADLLQKRFAARGLDLMVPIGALPAQFVVRYGEQAFPGIPAVFLAADERIVRHEILRKYGTIVSKPVKTTGWVEDILRLAPDTTNIVVVVGNSYFERFWLSVMRSEFQIFSKRVQFTWLEGLSLDEIEKRVSVLPPHSFILFGLMIEDSSGITYSEYEGLRRLHAAANAPIYGVFQSYLGHGIVGGRLYQDQTLGTHAAVAAARILRGEPAESIPEELLPPPSAVYDWRELERWGISETRLPPGSSVFFREPTVWQQYQWYIVGFVLFVFAETLLTAGLLTNLIRRRRAESESQTLRRELAHFSRVATINELTTSIAHEINQPLGAILSNAQAALQLIEGGEPDLKELREIFNDIVIDDQRAADVIRSIRSLLKKDALEHQPLKLNDLIMDVLALVRNEASVRKVSIFPDLVSKLSSIRGDRVQLQQVILNMIFNAFEAMESAVQPRELRIRTHEVDREVVLDIADSGPGIPPDKINTIFEPFFTTKKEGLGMGLPLCRSIVTAHNGRLWAESNPDGGATFHVALPRR